VIQDTLNWTKTLKVALAQINPVVGDLSGNAKRIEDAARIAASDSPDLVVFSELAICGYPPKDLLLRDGFTRRCDETLEQLARHLKGQPPILVGHPTGQNVPDGRIANAASLLVDGVVQQTIQKVLLPNYDVFDERRYFRRADVVQPIDFCGRKLGVHICEDAWWGESGTIYHLEPERYFDPIARLVAAGADILINLSASPFEINKPNRRVDLIRRNVEAHGVPFVFVNQVGGNDDLVFDGNSFCLDATGDLIVQCSGFETDLQTVDVSGSAAVVAAEPCVREQQLLDALILGLRDYVRKCGFKQCVFGSSGGIDSALACYLAAEALGPENVHVLMMPSRYSSQHSIDDAVKLAGNLNIDYEIIPIDAVHSAYEATPTIRCDLKLDPTGLPEQNLQARIRGAMVMVRSNQHGWMALATGNKSELAVGYCTLYGDMCGGFAVLSDVLKRDVYAASRYINEVREGREVIPNHIINKAPSAELAPNQVDQDTLPPYPILDAILEGLIEREDSIASLSEIHSPETVRWVAARLDRNEFKRRQMPPGIKLSARAFGSGRRMPMAARIDYS
jgi:NAD+ synthase (glutamine-hydrolysing)